MIRNEFIGHVVSVFEATMRCDGITHIGAITLGGSRAYGLETPESDYDLRGWYFLPEDMQFGICRQDVITKHRTVADGEGVYTLDIVLYSLPKFLQMLISGNPQAMEMLSVAPEHILLSSQQHRDLIARVTEFRKAPYIKTVLAITHKFVRRVESKKPINIKDAQHILRLLHYADVITKNKEFVLKFTPTQRNLLLNLRATLEHDQSLIQAISTLTDRINAQLLAASTRLEVTRQEQQQQHLWAVEAQKIFYQLWSPSGQRPGDLPICQECVFRVSI